MAGETTYLALYLDGPLQSWGYQSRFDRRVTLSYPTRSGVIGMICAAMGIDRTDTESLVPFRTMQMSIFAFREASRLVDFHTVGGGWDKKTHRRHLAPKASGALGDTVVTQREYLQDSRFGVVLSGGRERVAQLGEAVRDPNWGIWLGRKSCIPSSPVFQGVFESSDAALERLVERAGTPPLRVIEEVVAFADGTSTLMDIPVNYATREFVSRRVCEDSPE